MLQLVKILWFRNPLRSIYTALKTYGINKATEMVNSPTKSRQNKLPLNEQYWIDHIPTYFRTRAEINFKCTHITKPNCLSQKWIISPVLLWSRRALNKQRQTTWNITHAFCVTMCTIILERIFLNGTKQFLQECYLYLCLFFFLATFGFSNTFLLNTTIPCILIKMTNSYCTLLELL